MASYGTTLSRYILTLLVLASCARGDFDEEWPEDPVNRFRQDDFLHDTDHLQEHAPHLGVDLSQITGEEREFYFFNMHDLNNDNRLDGLEILSSLRHGAEETYARVVSRGGTPQEQATRMEKLNTRMAHTVDIILREDDLDHDGYLTYTEFQFARRANIFLEHGRNTDPQGFTAP